MLNTHNREMRVLAQFDAGVITFDEADREFKRIYAAAEAYWEAEVYASDPCGGAPSRF